MRSMPDVRHRGWADQTGYRDDRTRRGAAQGASTNVELARIAAAQRGDRTTVIGAGSTPDPGALSDSDSGDDIVTLYTSITFPVAGLWAFTWRADGDFTDDPFWFHLVAGSVLDSTSGAGVAQTATLAGSIVDTFSEGQELPAYLEANFPVNVSGLTLAIEAHFIR